MEMRVEFERSLRGVDIARPQGTLDLETAPSLKRQLFARLEDGISCLIVNLGEVDFIDSTGLEALASVWTRARMDRVVMFLVVRSERMAKLFRVCGMDRVMHVVTREPDLESLPV